MPRPPRLSLASYPRHVIQRGGSRQPIFLEAMIKGRESFSERHPRLY